MKLVNLLVAMVVAFTSLNLVAGEKVVVKDAQDFVATMAGDVAAADLVLQIEDQDAFVAELVAMKVLTAEEASAVLENPEKVLVTEAPAGNASHHYRYRRPYVANPVWWLALLIVLSTPAYY